MRKLKSKINAAVIMTAVLMFTGCAHLADSENDAPAAPVPSPTGDRYASEIVELNHIVQQNSDPAKATKAHLELAKLYASYKNPHRNYQKALSHLKVYSASTDSAGDDEARNWMAALKEIERLSKDVASRNMQIRQLQGQLEDSKKAKLAIKKSNRKLTSEEIKLREKNRKLEESNQKLQKTIEMLKNLDKRLEEKRKDFND